MPEISLETAVSAGNARKQRTADGDVVTVVGPFPEETTVTHEEDSVTVPAGQYAVLSDHLEAQAGDAVDRLEAPTPPGAGEPSGTVNVDGPVDPTPAVEAGEDEVKRVSDLVLSGDAPLYERQTPDGLERVAIIGKDADVQTVSTPSGTVLIPKDSVGIVRGNVVEVVPADTLEEYQELDTPSPSTDVPSFFDSDGFLVVHRSHIAVANKITGPAVLSETEQDPADNARHTLPKVITQGEAEAGAYVLRKGGGVWAISQKELEEDWVKVATIGSDDEKLEIDAGAPSAAVDEVAARVGEVVPHDSDKLDEVTSQASGAVSEVDTGDVQNETEAGASAEVDATPANQKSSLT